MGVATIDPQKIQEWTRMFLDHVNAVSIPVHVQKEEGYKFAAVDHFQSHFDLEAPDLAGMLEKAILNTNLVVGAQFWPRKMLLIYARDYPEETRAVLRHLFDESKDIYTRLTEADAGFNAINATRNAKDNGSARTYIGLRFLSLLLGFRFPEKYNALKPAEWKFFARFMDPGFSIPAHTPAGEQYRLYEPYIEAVRQHLIDRPEIQPIRTALIERLAFKDDEFRWMTQNVIYVTARILSGKKSDLSAEEVIQDEVVETAEAAEGESGDIGTGFIPLEKHLEEYIVKNWDLIDFGEKLTLYRDEDDAPAQQYTTDVGIIDLLAKDADGDFVVIELKRAAAGYHVIGQVLNYMTWVQENLATKGEKVRGMVVVGHADKTLKHSLRQVADKVAVREYRVKMSFIDPM